MRNWPSSAGARASWGRRLGQAWAARGYERMFLGGSVETSVSLQGTSPWPPGEGERGRPVETSVKLQGTSPWPPEERERARPVETSVSLQGTSPWPPEEQGRGGSPGACPLVL